MTVYRPVLGIHLVETLSHLPARQRDHLIRGFNWIAANIHEPADSTYRDGDHRLILEKRYLRWHVSYWLDGPVSEVRIVGVRAVK